MKCGALRFRGLEVRGRGGSDSFAARSGAIRFVRTPERLLDETSLLLHRSEANLSEEQRRMLARARQVDSKLAGRKALVVDDDLRNIFALTSILEHHDLKVYTRRTAGRVSKS